jgi:flagellar motility protein MotE (MotC chaperone)
VRFGNPLHPLKRHIRLLPAVLSVGTVLLAVKGAGLVIDAKAQEQQGAATPAASSSSSPSVAEQAIAAATNNSTDPDDAETSSAQVDVLTSLSKRRSELDGRERDLDMRENLITAAEKRVDGKIDSLKQLQSSIQGLLTQRDAAEQKQLDALVKTYSSMKPKDAARIFDSLDETVALSVAAQMKPDVLAPIIGAMQSDAAQKLTVRLANRLKVPQQQQQTAALAQAMPTGPVPAAAPAATTPAPAATSAPTPITPQATPPAPAAAPPPAK